MKGKVKFFHSRKGWGFLAPENGGVDIFVHYKKIDMEGFKNLKTDDEVDFEVENGEYGPVAVNVRRVSA